MTSSSRLLPKAGKFRNLTGKLVEVALVQARISRSRVISREMVYSSFPNCRDREALVSIPFRRSY